MNEEPRWEEIWLYWAKEVKRRNSRWRKFTRLFIKRCPKCDGKLDYNHIGYKGDRPYCHNCKWQSKPYEKF